MSEPPRSRLAERILIVPSAHTRVGDVAFQLEMYELFHRTPGARIGHMVGTSAILLGVLLLLARAPGPAAPALVVAAALGVTAWGLAIDRLAGVVTAIVLAVLAASAAALARALGPGAAGVAAALVFGGGAVQTFSHLFEDVPPPQSGTAAFVPVSAWLRRVDARGLVASAVLTFGVYFWLELWAALRILPMQALHLLMRAGHRADLRRALDARVAEILRAPASDWRRPRGAASR